MAITVTHSPFSTGIPVYVQTYVSPSVILLQGDYIMYLSTTEALFMIVCGSIVACMTALLFIANYTLLKQNRYLKSRLQAWRKSCANRHVEVPF